jgi:hypothetical protein
MRSAPCYVVEFLVVGRANMKRSGMTGQRLAAIFLMGCILFNYPILFLFTRSGDIAGIPLLYAYVFGAWALLIGLMALVVERPRE